MNQPFATARQLKKSAAGHESPEVDLLRTVISAAAVAVMIVVSVIVSHWIFSAYLQPADERSATPLSGTGLVLPPAPRLEGIEMMSSPTADIDQSTLARQLQTYGWVDRDKGLVRVPIERAMQLAIERDWLPSSSKSAHSASDAAGASSSSSQPSRKTQ